jgi:hypothetical protein
MTRRRGRVSIPKEDRIWDLRCQGYDYDSIARITNVSLTTPGKVIRRVMRRPPFEKDPIKRGRKSGFLSDRQIHEIRLRHKLGETQLRIAEDFGLHVTAINKICCHKTYAEDCDDNSYPYSFCNRLIKR